MALFAERALVQAAGELEHARDTAQAQADERSAEIGRLAAEVDKLKAEVRRWAALLHALAPRLSHFFARGSWCRRRLQSK